MNINVGVNKALHTTEDATRVRTSLVCGKEGIIIEFIKGIKGGSNGEILTIISGSEIQACRHRNDDDEDILMLMGTNLMAVIAANPTGQN